MRAQSASAPASAEKARPAYSEPGVSPDGKEIAFVSGGDIWTVPASMELHPRPVDFLVKRPMGESYTDHDVQLDTAVRELLKEIPNSARPQM